MHQEFSARGTASAEHHLNTDRRSQTSKASQSPQNEVRQKIKIKKREKGFRDGDLCLGEGDVKETLLQTQELPPRRGRGRGGFRGSEGSAAAGAQQAEGRELSPETAAEQPVPAEKRLTRPRGRE